MREVACLADRAVGELLERRLHPDVPLRGHVVGGHENALPPLGHFVEVDVAFLRDALHQLVGVPPLTPRHGHEVFVHIRHQNAGLVAHERYREQGLDARRAAGDDRDSPRRRHRGQITVPQPPERSDTLTARVARAGRVRPPNALFPFGEHSALAGESLALDFRFLVHEGHQAAGPFDRFVGVVGDAEAHEKVRPPHQAEPDATDALGQIGDLLQGIAVDVDHIVQEVRAEIHRAPQAVPIHLAVLDEHTDIYRPEVTYVIGEKRLLAAGVRRLVGAQVRHRVVLVRAIDEEHTGLAGLPGAVHDLAEHLAWVELPHHFSRTWMQ